MKHYSDYDGMLLAKLGEQLKIHRVSKGMSQEKLAELAGLHRTYIGSVERGERNISIINLDRISKALGIETKGLL